MKKLIEERNKSAEKSLEKIKKEVSEKLAEEKIKFEIDGRVKSVYSLHKKLAKYNQNIDEVYDLFDAGDYSLTLYANDGQD